nr:hypothetical protein [Tanacetum cinerariifolium]
MIHICPRLPGQTFDELLFEEEILAFLRFFGHSGEIRKLTDVNINKLQQAWRSFAAVINKCLSRKNFVYQIEHKDAKKSNEMYYPRFTKNIQQFGLDHRLKTLEANFSEFVETNQFARAVSSILGIVQRYMDQRMNEAVKQRNLYKALVEAYESEKIILDTYGDTVTLKRRHDDADKDKEPSARSDRGSKRRREGKEPESTSDPKKKATKTTGKSTQGSKSNQKTASDTAPVEEPMQTTQDLEEPSHQEFETGAADDQPITEAS